MQDDVSAALDQQDYQKAAQRLKVWKAQSPNDPWLGIYIGRYQEATGKDKAAETTYRSVLKATRNPKVMTQARNGIERIVATREANRQGAIAQAKAAPGSDALSMLLLDPVPSAQRQVAAQGLASVMGIDPYTARMQLPSKGFRIYRVGGIGELKYYGESLQRAQTPAYWTRLDQLTSVEVFQVRYFRAVAPRAVVVCANDSKQLGTITFDWSEVNQRASGLLPIFESVVDLGPWQKLQRKQKTQDYAYVLDLHLYNRSTILRLCDRTYEFQQGDPLDKSLAEAGSASLSQTTTRHRWDRLTQYLETQIDGPLQADFTAFGEGAIEYVDLLPLNFSAHLDLGRVKPTNWDPAFQLYSSLCFRRGQENAMPRPKHSVS
ncbi:MAG: tetratricopeptide repeat protein [Cyanobacteria bacterium P01_H01_bin.119]